MERLKTFESKVAELINRFPPMPDNVEQLLAAANAQGEDDEFLLAMIKQDPGLCADLLHLANTFSARVGGHDETIEDAIESVGVRPLVQLVGIWYANDIIKEEFSELDNLEDYFTHSQDVSLACQLLSEQLGVAEHERRVHSVAGLIHDIGRLAIVLVSKSYTAPLLGTQWPLMEKIVHEERELLGMDHCVIGMQLCKKWNFSPLLQEAVLRHHSPLIEDDFNYLAAIIFISHFIAFSDFTGEMLSSIMPGELLDRLGLTQADFMKTQQEYFSRKKEG